jgi:TPR repeat protein
VAVNETVPSISGPSLLGLDQGNVDVFRDRAFSGLASYGQPEEPKSAGKEVLLTLLLLAALGGAGWWTYKNYIGAAGNRKPEVAAPANDAANTPTANNPSEGAAPKTVEKSDVKATPPAAEHPSEDASNAPAAKTPAESPTASETKESAEAVPEKTQQPVTPTPKPARHEVSASRIPASKTSSPAGDSGDALFRRGEGYLYGRNGSGNCGNALKYLKMAADMQHAKARSMMGTMYATGHCVPRDLPSSYRWFALALRVDPNNSVVEKNLSAVWNQMTPPERQLATKSQ